MAEAKKAIPKSFNLRSFFGDYFDIIRRTGSDRAEELIELVEERRECSTMSACLKQQRARRSSRRVVVRRGGEPRIRTGTDRAGVLRRR